MKNYCEREDYDFSDSDEEDNDKLWSADGNTQKKGKGDRRKLIRLTRYLYEYLLKHKSGNYSNIF